MGIEADTGSLEAIKQEAYAGKEEAHPEIRKMSRIVQKTPEETYSCMLNERTLLIIRHGILISIEKELSRLGYVGQFKLAKRNLEKTILHNSGSLEPILQAKINDVFVDWDVNLDKSVIVVAMSPNS